jgi:hypothetical protein
VKAHESSSIPANSSAANSMCEIQAETKDIERKVKRPLAGAVGFPSAEARRSTPRSAAASKHHRPLLPGQVRVSDAAKRFMSGTFSDVSHETRSC